MKFKEIIVKTINVTNKTYVDSNGATQTVQPLEIYLVPIPSTAEHERYVVDNTGVISKQFSGSRRDFIPLSGTEVNKPVTGNIELNKQFVEPTIYEGNLEENYYRGLKFNWDDQFVLGAWNSSAQYSEINLGSTALDITHITYNGGSSIRLMDNTVTIGNGQTTLYVGGDAVLVSGLPNAQDDPTFTRQIVQKEDGTLGYIKNGFESGQIDSFGQFPGDSISGICTYEYQKGSKYVTVRLKIYIYLGTEDGNPHEVWINVPFGLGYTQQRIFDAFTGDSAIMTTQLNQISFMKTTRESMGVNIAACYTFPYGAEAGDD